MLYYNRTDFSEEIDVAKSNNSKENSVLDDHGYVYIMHIKEINIKNRVYNYYFDNIIKPKKLDRN